MDPAAKALFLESPLYKDLKTAFHLIIERRIGCSHDFRENEVLKPYYFVAGLPKPRRGGCWCAAKNDSEQCSDIESCPCKPRPFMDVNMYLASCRRDHDKEGKCVGRHGATRDCFNPRNLAEPYFRDILSRRSEPQTPWPQEWKEGLAKTFCCYTAPGEMDPRFANAVYALIDDMVDPFKAGNAGWLPHIHGVLGWYGQTAESCILWMTYRMCLAREDRYDLEHSESEGE